MKLESDDPTYEWSRIATDEPCERWNAIEGSRLSEEYSADLNRHEAYIIALRKDLARLSARAAMAEAERLIAREYNKLRNAKRGTGVLADWQRRLSSARASLDAFDAENGATHAE